MGNPTEYSFPHPVKWLVRYHKFIFTKYSDLYARSHDRDGFLRLVKTELEDLLIPVAYDPYLKAITHIWQRGFHYKERFSRTLEKIEKIRQDYLAKQWAADEFPLLFGENKVRDFVQVSDQRSIIKFLITRGVANYFFDVIVELENNRKSGGLRDATEITILRKAENRERITPTTDGAQVGLKWNSAKFQEGTKYLYEHLMKGGFIAKEATLQNFQILFSDQPVDHRIRWKKEMNALLFFIETLLDKELLFMPREIKAKRKRAKELFRIKARNKNKTGESPELRTLLRSVNQWLYPRINACFTDKNNKPFDGRLKHVRSSIFNKANYPKSADELVKLAERISRI